MVAARICGGRKVWSTCRLLRDGGGLLEHGAAAMSGAAKKLIKKNIFTLWLRFI